MENLLNELFRAISDKNDVSDNQHKNVFKFYEQNVLVCHYENKKLCYAKDVPSTHQTKAE